MDEKAVVGIHNGILLSYWKECIWISSNEVNETGAYYTEWSKSERKAPIQYINGYIWNLEKWWWWPYMLDSKRDTEIKNRLLDSVGEGKVGWFERIALKHIYYHMRNRCPVQIDAWDRVLGAGAVGRPWGMGWVGRCWVVQDGGHMYIHGWFMSVYGKNHYNIIK